MMKLSVSLIPDDVAFLDRYAAEKGIASRSAAVQEAIHVLQLQELSYEYDDVWAEWEESEDAALWETTIADGLDEAD